MIPYSLLRPFLFQLEPEFSHNLTLNILKKLADWHVLPRQTFNLPEPIQCFGLTFNNPVGLAAGLDKNAECIAAWQAMGFGFVEVGTVTPRPQPGNPKPRLFRLLENQAIINRLGFNNKGIDFLISQVKVAPRSCPIGINIGKNKDTPLAQAAEDYLICFQKAYPYADYVTVNLSSPNTPGLRDLQQGELLKGLIVPLKEAQKRWADEYGRHVPILVKLSPDMDPETLKEVIQNLLTLQIEGVIATNTTLDRPGYLKGGSRAEEGGLSGEPLFEKSTATILQIYQQAGEALPIMGVGGIMTPEQAKAKLAAGAKLIQLYTGFIYKGPTLIKQIAQQIGL